MALIGWIPKQHNQIPWYTNVNKSPADVSKTMYNMCAPKPVPYSIIPLLHLSLNYAYNTGKQEFRQFFKI